MKLRVIIPIMFAFCLFVYLGLGFVSGGGLGEQRTLVILVNYADLNNPSNISAVNATVFTDVRSANNYYRSTTYNRTWFTGEVVGPVTINYTYSGRNCNQYHAWADSADLMVRNMGYNVSQYSRVQYIIPNFIGCGWSGMAAVSGVRSWIDAGSSSMVHAHEFGHNLGMGHASSMDSSTGTTCYEYGDMSDVMGNIGYFHVNSPHTYAQAWNSNIIDATSDGIYTVAHTAVNPSSTSLPIAVRVLQNVSNLSMFNGTAYIPSRQTYNTYYYLSFRRPTGWDSGLYVTYADKLNIHKFSMLLPTSTSANTYFMDAIGLGRTYVGNTKFGQVIVTPLSYDNNQMTFMINITNSSSGSSNNSNCVYVAPTVYISPPNRTGHSGSTLSYTGSLTNNDASGCPSETFNLGLALPSGFNGTVSPSSVVLAPGAIAVNINIGVRSAGNTSAGNYQFNFTSSGTQAIHSASTSATYSVITDSSPPTAPSRLAGSSVKSRTSAKIKLTWRASTDNVGVTEYQVFRNGLYYASVGGATLTYTDNSVVKGTPYTYYAVAKDAAGNTSPQSNIVTVTA